jgi:hydrogenase nickel incorporation protein HypA/HybF
MHELSIAMSIVETASEEAQRHAGRVEVVHLRLGALSGVVKDALLFSWDLACEDTPLAGARLEIEEIPVVVWCPACRIERTLDADLDLRCPACGGSGTELRSGRELDLSALEIEESPA